MMPNRVELAHLRECEAEAVERAASASDLAEKEAHFASAAEYVVRIKAIEQEQSSKD